MPEKIVLTGISEVADGKYYRADLVAAKDAEISRLHTVIMEEASAAAAYLDEIHRLRECVRDLVDACTWESPRKQNEQAAIAVKKHADTIKAAQEAGE